MFFCKHPRVSFLTSKTLVRFKGSPHAFILSNYGDSTIERLQTLFSKLGNANQHDGWYPMLNVSMILPRVIDPKALLC
jgi:hypothetical protein